MTRATAAIIVLVFLSLRIALLAARDPFFDELFTVWISAKPFAGILHALRSDSGPPLYYFIVHALALKSVIADRVLSLVFASASLFFVMTPLTRPSATLSPLTRGEGPDKKDPSPRARGEGARRADEGRVILRREDAEGPVA
jgi:hypothetical protein